jgi:hypothetical protein
MSVRSKNDVIISVAFHRMEPAGAERHRREAQMGEQAGASESNALQLLPK